MSKTFIYNHEKKEVREKAMEKPCASDYTTAQKWEDDWSNDNDAYKTHLANLAHYPAEGFPAELDGKELVEGKDFEIEEQFWEGTAWWPTKHLLKIKEGTKVRTLAIPIKRPSASTINKKFETMTGIYNARQENEYHLPIAAIPLATGGEEKKYSYTKEELIQIISDLIMVINGLLGRPDGCPMCDSGKLRNPQKEHWDECPYKIAVSTLIKYKRHKQP